MMKKRAMIRSTAIKDRRNEDLATGSSTIVTMATNTDFRMWQEHTAVQSKRVCYQRRAGSIGWQSLCTLY